MDKIKEIVTVVVFVGLLIMTEWLQNGQKENPQIVMLILGGLTLLSFILKQNTISTILFFILLGVMLFIFYFALTNWILDLLNPDRGVVVIDGKTTRGDGF